MSTKYRYQVSDSLCDPPAINMAPRHMLSVVCTVGGVECPLLEKCKTQEILDKIRKDPTATIRFDSDADRVPHYSTVKPEEFANLDREWIFNRKRDLEVMQRMGLTPGVVTRARHIFMRLFETIKSPVGICAYDTPGWEGCPAARSGAYEKVHAKGWQSVVYLRSDRERADYRGRNVDEIRKAEHLYVRPHHFMCLSCWVAGDLNKDCPRDNDSLFEIWQRIKEKPDIPVTLIEGPCMACDCCDGYFPDNGRCVHDCGLIRDFKKDLDVFQKLGLYPGVTLPARKMLTMLFEKVGCTTEVCGSGTGLETSKDWRVCGGPTGNQGFVKTRSAGGLLQLQVRR